MPPFNRFASSKYKNQLLEPAKLDKTFSELPSTVPCTSPNGRTIDCGVDHLALSLGTSPWNLLIIGTSVGLIDWRDPKKLGGKIERVDVGGRIGDLCWSTVESCVLGVVTSSGVLISRVD